MIFIYGDNRNKVRPALVTTAIVVLCTIIWLIASLSFDTNDLKSVALSPQYFFGMERPENITFIHNYFTLISHAFVHMSFFHLLGNMILLWALAPTIECKIGHLQFMALFLGCAIVAGLLYSYQNRENIEIAIGASGAVYGIMGAYLVLFPNQKLKCVIWFFTLIRFEVPAYTIILLYFILDYYYASAGFEEVDKVAYWAHVGGFIFGFIVGLVEKKRLIDDDIQKPDKDWYA